MTPETAREHIVWIFAVSIFALVTLFFTIPVAFDFAAPVGFIVLLLSILTILYPSFISKNRFGRTAKLTIPSILALSSIGLYITAFILGIDFWHGNGGWFFLLIAHFTTGCLAMYTVVYFSTSFIRKNYKVTNN